MTKVALQHSPALTHHVGQAEAWLNVAESGKNTSALAYAALELRFAIERLAVHYWAGLIVGTESEAELMEIGGFKAIESRIYGLAGHQREINKRFEFVEIMSSMLGIPLPKGRPNLPVLRKHWHTCSEMCHIGWALACVSSEIATQSYKLLATVKSDLQDLVTGLTGWPVILDPSTKQLERNFIDGVATPEDVRSRLSASGLHAQYTAAPDAVPVSVGTAVPPEPSDAKPS